MTAVGVVWIVDHDRDLVIGIELSARTQVGLLGAEILTLALFAIVALVKVYAGNAPAGSIHPSLSWFNPFVAQPAARSPRECCSRSSSTGAGTATVTVNEETEDSSEAPGQGDRDQRP